MLIRTFYWTILLSIKYIISIYLILYLLSNPHYKALTVQQYCDHISIETTPKKLKSILIVFDDCYFKYMRINPFGHDFS